MDPGQEDIVGNGAETGMSISVDASAVLTTMSVAPAGYISLITTCRGTSAAVEIKVARRGNKVVR
jgi:hypothetical protein